MIADSLEHARLSIHAKPKQACDTHMRGNCVPQHQNVDQRLGQLRHCVPFSVQGRPDLYDAAQIRNELNEVFRVAVREGGGERLI